MKILEFSLAGSVRPYQISLDKRFLGQFVEASDGHRNLPDNKATVISFINSDGSFDKLTSDFVPKDKYIGLVSLFSGGDDKSYWNECNGFKALDRPDSDFGIKLSDPLAELEDLNIRRSNDKFKVGDTIKYNGPSDAGQYADIFEQEFVNELMLRKPLVVKDVDYGTNMIAVFPGGGKHAYWWILEEDADKFNVDPLAELEDLNIRLSDNSQITFKVGDKVQTVHNYSRNESGLRGFPKDHIFTVSHVNHSYNGNYYVISLEGVPQSVISVGPMAGGNYAADWFQLAKIVDPLEELEDLNIRLSKHEFKVGDWITITDDFFIGNTRGYGVTKGNKYLILEENPEFGDNVHFYIRDDRGRSSSFQDGWFSPAVMDPLEELEDLNIRG